jgi:hypothetical protein
MTTTQGFAVWVEFWYPGANHGHLMLIKNWDEVLSMTDVLGNLEDYAQEFAEMFEKCDGERHNGRAHAHENEEIQMAYAAASHQLLTVDYAVEWGEILRQQRVYKKWGGAAPALVLSPNLEDNGWEMLITDSEGNPSITKIQKGVMDDAMPSPRELGAKKNKYGLGWTLPRRRN